MAKQNKFALNSNLNFIQLKTWIIQKIRPMKKFKPIRGKIGDFFKLLKQGLNMKPIHKYTPKSVKKTVYLNVFLGSLIISRGFYSKTAIQQLSEN